MPHILRLIQLPHGIVLVTTLLSFSAWLLPDFSYLDKGYRYPQPLISTGGVLVIFWYGSVYGLTWVGFSLGRYFSSWKKPHAVLDAQSRLPYLFLTTLGCLGLAAAWIKILSSLGVSGAWSAVTSGLGNALKESVYENYSIGILSLRYLVILASAIAVYNLVRGVRSTVDYVNVCLLMLETVVSHRLALVASCLIALGLLTARGHFARATPLKSCAAGSVLFVLISAFTYARNANYYHLLGIYNMFGMGASEIISYLGGPFQGALAVGNERALIGMNLPIGQQGDYTGIPENYTTNSALIELANAYGLAGIVCGAIICCVYAFVMGTLYHIRVTYQGLAYWVCLYPFAEFYRLFWFRDGIFIALLVMAFASGAIAYFKEAPARAGAQRVNRGTGKISHEPAPRSTAT